MCKRRSQQTASRIPDRCIREEIKELNRKGVETVSSCCGHGRYPKTILWRPSTGGIKEYFTGIWIGKKRRFYERDKDGYFFVPEIQ